MPQTQAITFVSDWLKLGHFWVPRLFSFQVNI